MDKLEVLDKLKKKGYECLMENNVPMIRTDDKTITMNKLRVVLTDLGYDGSFGLRIGGASLARNDAENSEMSDDAAENATEETSEDILQGADAGSMYSESEDGQISFI
ncbi:MAG: hypothetical protein KBS85_02625 [Lachnospiraceae bacterium]|nr:hypothetical protein [Candidatus Merdinaster equi]